MEINYSSNITLENTRLILSPLTLDHFDSLRVFAVDEPDLLKYSPSKFGTKDLLHSYIEKAIRLRSEGLKYSFVIYDKVKSKFAGSTSYLNISEFDMRLEIGSTWIGKDFQKTGLNRNCKFLMMSHAFKDLKIERLEFNTDARNIQSQKAIERIGGIKEGVLRSHMLMSDGIRRDTVCYSILKEEWPLIRNTVFKEIF